MPRTTPKSHTAGDIGRHFHGLRKRGTPEAPVESRTSDAACIHCVQTSSPESCARTRQELPVGGSPKLQGDKKTPERIQPHRNARLQLVKSTHHTTTTRRIRQPFHHTRLSSPGALSAREILHTQRCPIKTPSYCHSEPKCLVLGKRKKYDEYRLHALSMDRVDKGTPERAESTNQAVLRKTCIDTKWKKMHVFTVHCNKHMMDEA